MSIQIMSIYPHQCVDGDMCFYVWVFTHLWNISTTLWELKYTQIHQEYVKPDTRIISIT